MYMETEGINRKVVGFVRVLHEYRISCLLGFWLSLDKVTQEFTLSSNSQILLRRPGVSLVDPLTSNLRKP